MRDIDTQPSGHQDQRPEAGVLLQHPCPLDGLQTTGWKQQPDGAPVRTQDVLAKPLQRPGKQPGSCPGMEGLQVPHTAYQRFPPSQLRDHRGRNKGARADRGTCGTICPMCQTGAPTANTGPYGHYLRAGPHECRLLPAAVQRRPSSPTHHRDQLILGWTRPATRTSHWLRSGRLSGTATAGAAPLVQTPSQMST